MSQPRPVTRSFERQDGRNGEECLYDSKRATINAIIARRCVECGAVQPSHDAEEIIVVESLSQHADSVPRADDKSLAILEDASSPVLSPAQCPVLGRDTGAEADEDLTDVESLDMNQTRADVHAGIIVAP